MARAWIEFVAEEEVFDAGRGKILVSTRKVLREVERDPEPPDLSPRILQAMTNPRRPAWPFYLAFTLAGLVFTAGLVFIGLGVFDVSKVDHTAAGFGWGLLAFSVFLVMATSNRDPEVCTCPDHHNLLGGCSFAVEIYKERMKTEFSGA